MSALNPVRWFGHVARAFDGNIVRVAWMIAEPSLAQAGQVQSHRSMAAALGISTRTVIRAIGRLEAEGLVRVRGGIGRGRVQRYRLMLPRPAGGSTA